MTDKEKNMIRGMRKRDRDELMESAGTLRTVEEMRRGDFLRMEAGERVRVSGVDFDAAQALRTAASRASAVEGYRFTVTYERGRDFAVVSRL